MLSDEICVSKDSNIINEICLANGAAEQDDHFCETAFRIELFFCTFTNWIDLTAFRTLQELVIISQPLTHISPSCLPITLKVLWICECRLRSITSLERLVFLKKLYLYDNELKEITGLEKSVNIEILWLNSNQLRQIAGLDHLKGLRELNLAHNNIQAISSHLHQNQELVTLNLAGNNIQDLEELLNLKKLPNLRHLTLNCPLYGRNPVCTQPNVLNILLTNLPELLTIENCNEYLDEIRSSFHRIRSLKSRFYFTKFQHSCARFQSKFNCLSRAFDLIHDAFDHNLRATHQLFTQARWLVQQRCSVPSLQHFLDSVSNAQHRMGAQFSLHQQNFDSVLDYLLFSERTRFSLYLLEKEQFGNLHVTELFPTRHAFVSLSHLLESRFCLHSHTNASIRGIKLRRAYRLHNYTYTPLDEDEANGGPGSEFARCWFLPVDYSLEQLKHLHASSLKKWKLDRLQRSLNAADAPHLATLTQADMSHAHFVTVLVCNVVEPESIYPKPVPCTEQHCRVRHDELRVEQNMQIRIEYLLEYQYRSHGDSICDILLDNLDCTTTIEAPSFLLPASHDQLDLQLLQDEAFFKALTRRPATITAALQQPDLTVLHLDCCPQSLVKGVQAARSLKQLSLINCDLVDLNFLAGLNIETLNVSHNNLASLESMPMLPELKSFQVSYNKLQFAISEAAQLRYCTKHLSNLTVRFNPWRCSVQRRERAFLAYLLDLLVFDEVPVTQKMRQTLPRLHIYHPVDATALRKHGAAENLTDAWWTGQSSHFQTAPSDQQAASQPHERDIVSLVLCDLLLVTVSGFELFQQLRYINLDDNALRSLSPFAGCPQLECLSLRNNQLASLDGLRHLVRLECLYVSCNLITALSATELTGLINLRRLTLDNNRITRLDGIQGLSGLQELHLANNRIDDMGSVLCLQATQQLQILDLWGNPVLQQERNVRLKLIFHLRGLKALNGSAVTDVEVRKAKEALGGRVTYEYLIESLGHEKFGEMTVLSLPAAGLRYIDLEKPEAFANLTSVNLENNSLTSFSGLVQLKHLRVLCLNQNHIETLFPRQRGPQQQQETEAKLLGSLNQPFLMKLEVLHLAQNGIRSLQPLQLHRIPSLRSLFLQSNELTLVDALDGLQNLRELVLDRNRIKSVSELSFLYNWNLTELHIEENRLRDIRHLCHLEKLRSLFLGSNKLSDLQELEQCIGKLKNLREVSFVDNPFCKRGQHRLVLAYQLPKLLAVDGKVVSQEEREMAAAVHMEQQYQNLITGNPAIAQALANSTAPQMTLDLLAQLVEHQVPSEPDSKTARANRNSADLFPRIPQAAKTMQQNGRSNRPYIENFVLGSDLFPVSGSSRFPPSSEHYNDPSINQISRAKWPTRYQQERK